MRGESDPDGSVFTNYTLLYIPAAILVIFFGSLAYSDIDWKNLSFEDVFTNAFGIIFSVAIFFWYMSGSKVAAAVWLFLVLVAYALLFSHYFPLLLEYVSPLLEYVLG